MARGVKTDNKTIAKIITSYALTNSYNATAKELKISESTVRYIIKKQKKENNKEFTKIYEEKKELFQDKANIIIDKALELLKKRYDKALENEAELDEMISIIMSADKEDMDYQEKLAVVKKIGRLQLNSLSEITTSMGTLYDKVRLAEGKSTGNINVSYEESLKAVSGEDEY